MKPTFYLISGANGSGKTTLAHELLKDESDLEFLNADETAKKIGDKIGLTAGKIIQEKLESVISNKKSFAWESTISGNHHMRVLERAARAKYEIVLVYVFLDAPDVNIARVKKRVALGGHDIPVDDIIRRFHKSIRNFWGASKLADRWKLFYNGDDNYELVAEGNKKATEILNEDLYKKFKRGLKNG